MKKSPESIKKIPHLFLALLLIGISLQTVGLLFLTGAPNIAQAASKPIEMNLQVPIPTLNGGDRLIKFNGTTGPIADYIVSIYNYAVGIVGILAAVVMMIGGLMWITAGGNTSNIGEAKAMITASLTGLVLVLTSYLILSNVNPALVNLESSVIGTVGPVTPVVSLSKCEWKDVSQTHSNSIPGGGYYIAKDAGNCSDFNLGESTGGKDCDASKYPTDTKTQQYTKCCCEQTVLNAECNLVNPIRCQACSSCQALPASLSYVDGSRYHLTHDQVQLNSSLITMLGKINLPFTITEAWPPSANHQSSCHQNGTCLDLSPGGDIGAFAKQLVSAGFTSFQYECTNGPSCCTDISSNARCTYNSGASGAHFHVNGPGANGND